MSWPVTTEYHIPAPWTVTLLTITCPLTRKVPLGMKTMRPAALATAELKAAVESALPVGSAPKLVTEIELAGCARGGPTCSKSARSIV